MNQKKFDTFSKLENILYIVLYIMIISWIIATPISYLTNIDIFTKDITLFLPLIPLILLLIIQFIKEFKEKNQKNIKRNSTKIEKIFCKIFLIILLLLVILLINNFFQFLSNKTSIYLCLFMLFLVYIVLPFLWIIKIGFKKLSLLVVIISSLCIVKYFDSKFNTNINTSINSKDLIMITTIMSIIEQLYLYVLIENFLKRKNKKQLLNRSLIFITIMIEFFMIMNSIVWKQPRILSYEIVLKILMAIIFFVLKEILNQPNS